MNKTTQLKKLLLQRKALPCPGVYDALSARMVEYCGFQACQISGFGVSASSLGMTDASFTSLEEIVRITSNIVRAVDIPVHDRMLIPAMGMQSMSGGLNKTGLEESRPPPV